MPSIRLWRACGKAGHSARSPWGLWTGWLALLIGGGLAGAPELTAQGTPAGTRIGCTATVTYETENGLGFTVVTDPGPGCEEVVVAQVAGIALDPPGASISDPGTTVVFPHTLRNIGNGADSFTVAGRAAGGWATRVYLDHNGNGVLEPGEPLVPDPLPLDYGGVASLLFAADVPAQALRGSSDTLILTAVSRFDPTVSDTVIDLIQVRTAGVIVTLEKSVDRTTATIGEILTYTITYRATGSSSATEVLITDPIPVGTRYVAATLRLNGTPLTDSPDDDAGGFDSVADRIAVTLPVVTAGDSGVISFQVRVGS